MNYVLRRRGLGRTSCKSIVALSTTGLQLFRSEAAPAGDIVIRWGCTSDVDAKKIINKASAIHEVNNKGLFRAALNAANEDLCPATWFKIEDVPVGDGKKFVVRPQRHAQGRRLWVCETPAELQQACALAGFGYYISELINKVAEYRVFCANGRAIAVASKTPGNPNDVAWNVARGGKFENVRWEEWPLKAVKVAIEGFNVSSLDFGGVDVMVDAEGQAYILEINSAPSLTSPYRQSCMTKALDYMVTKGTERIPLVDRKGSYPKFIHPAVYPKAILV